MNSITCQRNQNNSLCSLIPMETNFLSQLKEYQPVMRAVARRWSIERPADEDDLYQEMALELWRLLQRRPDAPRKYITTVLRKVPLKYRARGSSVDRPSPSRRNHQWQIKSLESLIECNGNDGNHNHQQNWASPVEDSVIARLMQADLEERLTPRQLAFQRLRWQGYSPKDIHHEFGLSWSQVKGFAVEIRAKAHIIWDGDGPACVTLAEAACELGVSRRSASQYCNQGILKGARFERGRWLVPRPIRLLL